MVVDDVAVPGERVEGGNRDMEHDGEEVPFAEERVEEEGCDSGSRDRVEDVSGIKVGWGFSMTSASARLPAEEG